jgi:predicted PhzF superfamily epimerase YddE/YHI9
MPQSPSIEQLLEPVERAVASTLAYLEGPGATANIRVDRWGVREIAAHLLYWHQVTIDAALAAARSQPPRRFTTPVDDINEEAVAGCAGLCLTQILRQLKEAHRNLAQAIKAVPDSDAPLMYRYDGTAPSTRDRLRTIAHHWTGHLEELRKAAG